MAGNNTVKIDLQVASQGMDPAVQKSQTIKDNLTAAAGAMNRVSTGSTGGTAGSKAVSQKAAGQEYAAQRGVAGATGASARDFASESQGLGGLVRLYATFAANVYVAAAAFSALSKAMDTSNMIKGLDQLGAASGRNLGSLSKQLAAASDGAINLRDAAQAVAQASAAGLGGKQILELGDIAKKAAQALGVSMPDALSRISRGVTKLEPELLDELGIFTKLDEASRKYALALGKPVSALTDFEKRQGFANAVAEEGAKKFSNIKLDVNPYDKLLASFQNLAQTGLEFVNKVLGPVVNLLSENPVALAGLIAILGKSLLSQAIPALGQYKRGLEDQAKAATEALENAQKLRNEHRKYVDDTEAARVSQLELNSAKKAGIAVDKLAQSAGLSKATQKVLSSLPDVKKEINDTGALEKAIRDLNKQKAELEKRTYGESTASQKKAADTAKEIAAINAATAALQERVKAAEQYNRVAGETIRKGAPNPFSQEAKQIRDLAAATSKSASIGVLQDVSKTLDSSSISDAFKSLTRGISESSDKLTGFGKVMTGVRGVGLIFSSVVGGIASLMGTFSTAGIIATTVLAGLDFFFSKNAKSSSEAKTSFGMVTSSLENLDRTVDFIKAKDPLEQFNTESLVAKGTAVNELAKNLSDAFSKAAKEIADASWWDTLKDRFSKIWGGDTATRSAETLAKTVIKTLDAGGSETKAGKQIIELLGGLPTDAKQLTEQLEQADGALGPKLLENIKKVGLELGNLGSISQELDEAFKTIGKTFDTIVVSALPTDPLAKLGQEYLTLGDKIGAALKDPMTALVKLQELSGSESKLKLFSPELQKNLINYREELTKVASEITKLSLENKKLNTQEAEIDNARKQRIPKLVSALGAGSQQQGMGPRSLGDGPNIVQTQKAAAQESVAAVDRALERSRQFEKSFQNTTEKAAKLLTQAQSESYEKGTKLIEQSIGRGFAEARATISGAFADRLGDTEAGIKRRTELAIEANNRAKQDLDAKAILIDSQEGLRKALELAAIETALNTAQLAMAKPYQLPADIDTNKKNIATLQQQKLRLTNPAEADKKYGAVPVSKGKTPAELAQEALGAARAKIDAENGKLLTQQEDKLAALKSKNNSIEKSQQININSAVQDKYKIIAKGLPYFSEETMKAQQALAIQSETTKEKLEQKQFVDKIADSQRTIDTLSKKKGKLTPTETIDYNAARAAILENNTLLTALEKEQEERKKTSQAARDAEAKDNAKNRLDYELDLETRKTEIQTKSDQVLQEKRQATIELLKNLGISGAVELAKLEGDLALKQETDRTNTVLSEIEKRKTAEIAAKTALVATLNAPESGATPGDIAIAQADLDAATAYYDSLIAGETSASKLVLARIGYNNTLKTQVAEQATSMDSMKAAADSLAIIFGDVGKNFGQGLTGILTALQDANTKKLTLDQKYNADKLVLEKNTQAELDAIETGMGSYDDAVATQKKGNEEKLKLDKNYAKSSDKLEFDKNKQIVSYAKGMFKEKTFAYKALAAVEKIMHITKMAIMLKEMLFDKGATAQSVLNSGIRTGAAIIEAGVDGVKAVVKAISSLPFPLNLVAGAATAAVVGGLLSSIGGSALNSSASSAGMTSEDRQGTGAGETWKNGKKVETGGGVFGDPTAKSESITKSLDLLNATQVEGLSYDNQMVKLLTSINQSIGKAATGIYGTVGLTKGSLFNTEEGNKGFNILGGLFGSSKTKEILDSGIKFTGTFAEIMNNFKGAIQGFETVKTTSKSSFLWIKSSSASVKNNLKMLDDDLTAAISSVFNNAGELFVTSGAKLGMTAESVIAKLGDVKVDKFASLRGLKGEDLEKEFNNIVSSILDDTAKQLFTQFDTPEFKKFGEGMLQTVTRVIDTNEKINLSLISMGLSALNAEGDITPATARITQAMADQAGGLDKFLENIKFFVDNFLTEAERLAPIAAKVSTSAAKIFNSAVEAGVYAPGTTGALDTNAEFKALYLTLSQSTTPAAIALRNEMDLIAPSFLKATAQYEGLVKQTIDINAQSATQFMSEAEKLAYTRAQERKEITETNQVLFDFITELKQKSAELNTAGQALVKGYNDQVSAANSARSALLSVAKQGLGTLEAKATATKNEILNLARQGLSLLEAEVTTLNNDLLNFAKQGLSLLETKTASAKAKVLELAQQGLTLLETKAADAKAKVLELAQQGLTLLETKAADAKTEVLNLAQQGLELLQTKATDAKSELVSLATEGLGLLTTKLSGLQSELESLNSTGFTQLRDNVNSVKDSIKQSYKTAVENQKNANKAFVDSLRTVSKIIKDFLKSVALGDLAPEIDKADRLQQKYKQTLAAAQAGDETARSDLTQVAEGFLTAAKAQYANQVDYAKTFAEVTTDLAGVSDKIDAEATTAANGVVSLATESQSAADALKTANAELLAWTTTLEKSGLAAEVALDDLNTEKLNSAQTALSALDTATVSLNTWLGLIGKDAADILTKTDPKNLTELTAEFDSLKAKIATVGTDITNYIENTNNILVKAGVGENELLKPSTVLTEDTLKTQIKIAQDKLESADAAVLAYLTATNTTLTDAGFGTADLLKVSETTVTSTNVTAKITEAIRLLKLADTAVLTYLQTTNDTLTTAKFDTADLLKVSETTVTSANVTAKITEAIRLLKLADTAVLTYLQTTNDTLTTAKFDTADLLKVSETTVTSANVTAKITAAIGLLNKADEAVLAYLTATNTILGAAGLGTLTPSVVVTQSNVETILTETASKISAANAAVNKYVVDAKDILATAGFGDESKITPTVKVDKDNVSALMTETQTRLDNENKAVTAYIESTNAVLRAAGYGDDDVLTPTAIQDVTTAVATSNTKYTTAVENVKTWANTLAGLGVAFNPYGETATDLTTLSANFTTAQTAFNTANEKITSYVTNLTSLINGLTVPTLPTLPAAPAITTPATGGSSATTPGFNVDDYIASLGKYGPDSGPSSGEGSSNALGGVFDSGTKLKFAQGGAFTNSIVNGATMFNVAQMGEAGPEAIMPLTRGADGSLGVTAQLPDFGNRDETNRVLIAEIKELRNEVAKLRAVSVQNEYNTRKTKEVLQQVTVGGEYMQTKTVT